MMQNVSEPLLRMRQVVARQEGRRSLMLPVDLQVASNWAVALLGANGAGKTSVMLVAAGKLKPAEGEAVTLGYPSDRIPRPAAARLYEVIGWESSYDFLSLEQFWEWHHAFYPRWSGQVARDLAEELQVPSDRPLDRLSRGQKLKARLTCALGVRPELLILDEPFEGLDGRSRTVLKVALARWLIECCGGLLYSAHRDEDVAGLATVHTEIE